MARSRTPGPIDVRAAEFPEGFRFSHLYLAGNCTMRNGFWIQSDPESAWAPARQGLRVTDPTRAAAIDVLAREARELTHV